jgi:CRISPR-associated Csx10 family RAMP protein
MKKDMMGYSMTTLSPVLLSAGFQAYNLLETMDVIPGNAVRGVFAGQYLQRQGKTPEDELFKRLFLTGETRFGFACIEGAQPIPLSARTCKYDGGFEVNKGHGVIDLLLADEGDAVCPNCQKPIDYMEGFWLADENNEKRVKKRLATRTSIDPVLGTAGSGQLYSQRVVEENQIFKGIIEAPDDLIVELKTLTQAPFTAGVGRGKSRGQGWVSVQRDAPDAFNCGDASDRANQFKDENGLPMLAVTLLSDAIFQDDYLRDLTAPGPIHLQSLGVDSADWEGTPCKAFASTRLVFGFDGEPLYLPRIPRTAVVAGSVFLFKARDGKNPEFSSFEENQGIGWIGDNNGEGFGRAILWHPFHYSFKPKKEANDGKGVDSTVAA